MTAQVLFNLAQTLINVGLLWRIYVLNKSVNDRFELVAKHVEGKAKHD